jgi:toxic protein SymE
MTEKTTNNGKSLIMRTLKVYSKHFPRFDRFYISPEIRLCGKWLQNLNFNCGENVTLIAEKNRILIRNSEKVIVVL